MRKLTREEAKELLDWFRDWYEAEVGRYIKAQHRTAFLDHLEKEGAIERRDES